MVHRCLFFGVLCCSSLAFSSYYAFFNPLTFVEERKIVHFEGDYGKSGGATVSKSGINLEKMHYAEGDASFYFTGYIGDENSLTLQLGMNYIDLGWNNNPYFTKNQYPYGITSLTWISKGLAKWRWLFSSGVAVDTTSFNFGKTAVYYATVWGRYTQLENLGIHLGFFGYYGVSNGYVLPILGLDGWLSRNVQITAIFPMEVSLNLHMSPNWITSILCTPLGGPYRFPRKIQGGFDGYESGIFKIYSTVLEWDLRFEKGATLVLGIGGGWNFGGWIQLETYNKQNHLSYNIDGAPYARAFASFTF